MSRYANGKIYKLVNNVDKEIYIGSTCVPLHKRFYKHKHAANTSPDQKVYKHLTEIGWAEVQIILIESFPCENKMELEKRERYYIDQLSPSLNTSRPCVTEEENKQKLQDCKKEYNVRDYVCDLCQTTCKINVKQRHNRTKKHQLKAKEETQ